MSRLPVAGDVYYLKVIVSREVGPEFKYLVYLYSDPDPVFMKINTRSYHRDSEILLPLNEYSEFLSYDSNLDTYTIFKHLLTQNELSVRLMKRSVYSGRISDTHLREIIGKTDANRILSLSDKTSIKSAIEEYLH